MAKAIGSSMSKEGRYLRWLLALFVIAILLALLVPGVSAGWSYKKDITIDHTKVPATLSDFPVLISFTDTNLRDSAQTNGNDIVFTDSGNNVKYDHEIEHFVKSTGELEAWVRIQSLSSSSDTVITMWYGNSECGAQSNPTGVWDSSYKLVQHLAETSGACDDSTANDNDGTKHGGVTQTATGQINGADSFDGADGYFDCGDKSSLRITGPLTIEAWVNFDNYAYGPWDGLVAKWDYTYGGWGYGIFKETNSNKFSFHVASAAHSGNHEVLSNDNIGTGGWYHVVGRYDGTDLRLYINGQLQGDVDTYSGGIHETSAIFTIGTFEPSNDMYFDGTLDEVRISNTARNVHWITTCYNNQNAPGVGGFLKSVGAQTDTGGTDPVPELPTLILFSVGLLVLAGYVLLRKRL